MTNPFMGEIRLFAGTFAPQGWNFCDGTTVPIANNDALFALIGTTYGGDGVTTFKLPDLRGRVPIHQGTGTGVGTYTIGQTGGAESVVLDVTVIPSHTHALQASPTMGSSTDPTKNLFAQGEASCKLFVERAATTAYNAAHISSSGTSAAHDNMQPYIACNYIIAVAGIYPQQG